jgi:hypothetical protein
MMSNSPVVLVLAHYQLRDDAITDLAAIKHFLIETYVDLYDAALITTDAWDQAHINEWNTPIFGADRLLRSAFAALFERGSGGRQSPKAARGGAYDGLSRRDLEHIAGSLNPDATALVVAVQSGHPDEFAACFAHASRVAQRTLPVGSDGRYPSLSSVLHELMDPSSVHTG